MSSEPGDMTLGELVRSLPVELKLKVLGELPCYLLLQMADTGYATQAVAYAVILERAHDGATHLLEDWLSITREEFDVLAVHHQFSTARGAVLSEEVLQQQIANPDISLTFKLSAMCFLLRRHGSLPVDADVNESMLEASLDELLKQVPLVLLYVILPKAGREILLEKLIAQHEQQGRLYGDTEDAAIRLLSYVPVEEHDRLQSVLRLDIESLKAACIGQARGEHLKILPTLRESDRRLVADAMVVACASDDHRMSVSAASSLKYVLKNFPDGIPPRFFAAVQAAVGNSDDLTRFHALHALGDLCDQLVLDGEMFAVAVAILIDALADEPRMITQAAIFVLGYRYLPYLVGEQSTLVFEKLLGFAETAGSELQSNAMCVVLHWLTARAAQVPECYMPRLLKLAVNDLTRRFSEGQYSPYTVVTALIRSLSVLHEEQFVAVLKALIAATDSQDPHYVHDTVKKILKALIALDDSRIHVAVNVLTQPAVIEQLSVIPSLQAAIQWSNEDDDLSPRLFKELLIVIIVTASENMHNRVSAIKILAENFLTFEGDHLNAAIHALVVASHSDVDIVVEEALTALSKLMPHLSANHAASAYQAMLRVAQLETAVPGDNFATRNNEGVRIEALRAIGDCLPVIISEVDFVTAFNELLGASVNQWRYVDCALFSLTEAVAKLGHGRLDLVIDSLIGEFTHAELLHRTVAGDVLVAAWPKLNKPQRDRVIRCLNVPTVQRSFKLLLAVLVDSADPVVQQAVIEELSVMTEPEAELNYLRGKLFKPLFHILLQPKTTVQLAEVIRAVISTLPLGKYMLMLESQYQAYLLQQQVACVSRHDPEAIFLRLHDLAEPELSVVFHQLLSRGIDVNAKAGMRGDTLLHAAAREGNVPLVKLLVGAGYADLTITNAAGETAYDVAVNDEMREFLQQQLEVNQRTNAEITEYHEATCGFWEQANIDEADAVVPPEVGNLAKPLEFDFELDDSGDPVGLLRLIGASAA